MQKTVQTIWRFGSLLTKILLVVLLLLLFGFIGFFALVAIFGANPNLLLAYGGLSGVCGLLANLFFNYARSVKTPAHAEEIINRYARRMVLATFYLLLASLLSASFSLQKPDADIFSLFNSPARLITSLTICIVTVCAIWNTFRAVHFIFNHAFEHETDTFNYRDPAPKWIAWIPNLWTTNRITESESAAISQPIDSTSKPLEAQDFSVGGSP
jgi:hypothetical protein